MTATTAQSRRDAPGPFTGDLRFMIGLLALLASLTGAAHGQTFVHNGGFDRGGIGWNCQPGLEGAIAFEDCDYFQPPQVLRIEHKARRATSTLTQTVTGLHASSCYSVSVWIKVGPLQADADGGARVTVLGGSNGPPLAASPVFTRTAPWTQVVLAFNSGPHEAVTIKLALEKAAGVVRFDEVELQRGNLAPQQNQIAPDPSLVNIALGKPYVFSKKPNYPLCTDDGDAKDLTDGIRTVGHYWAQKSTVGWQHPRGPVSITIDLGRVEPILGAAFGTAGGGASVTLPSSIAVLVSDDGAEFHLAGDLVRLTEGPVAQGYLLSGAHTYRTRQLQTKGRYVRFTAVPSNVFLFCDELEVYRGSDDLLGRAPVGKPVTEAELTDKTRLTRLGCYRRLRQDLDVITRAAVESALTQSAKADALAQLAGIAGEIERSEFPDTIEGFRAIIPLNDTHRRMFAIYSRVLATRGVKPLAVWHSHPYQLLSHFEEPRDPLTNLKLALMLNERRAEVVNLNNATEQTKDVTLAITGLPGGANPPWIEVNQVEYVDTREARAVASALTPLRAQGGRFHVTVPAGMTRQVWLSFKPADVNAGTHKGRIELADGSSRHAVALELTVAPIRFPDRSDHWFGPFDYIAQRTYGITEANAAAALQLAADRFVNVAWSTGATPWPAPAALDKQGNLTGNIDYTKWDAYVRFWSRAQRYFVFASLHAKANFAGKAQGTPAFERALAQWAADWAGHNRQLGLKPRQATILFIDEPGSAADFKATWLFAKAFKSGTDEILVFSDPHIRAVNTEFGPEMLSVCDIICPNLSQYLFAGARARAACHDLARNGKELWLYSCTGPTRLFDPSYFRLQPWHCLEAGAVGSAFWAFGDSGNGDNWNEYWAVASCSYTPAYISADSVASSKHLEAAAEGIEDFQYLKMLKERVGALRRQGVQSPELDQAARLIETLAAGVIGQVLERYGNNYVTAWDNHSTFAEEGRLKVLEALTKLADKPR